MDRYYVRYSLFDCQLLSEYGTMIVCRIYKGQHSNQSDVLITLKYSIDINGKRSNTIQNIQCKLIKLVF